MRLASIRAGRLAGRRRAPPGFALPSVLFVVAMVTLVFLVAIEALTSLAIETRRVKTSVAFQADALSLEARTAFLASTKPLGRSGVLRNDPNAPVLLALDGRPYDAGPDLTLSAQDEAGLINLDNISAAGQARLFAAMGVSAPDQSVMADRLGDYMDVHDLKRPQGADVADYVRAGLRAPPKARWCGAGSCSACWAGTRWSAARSGALSPTTSPPIPALPPPTSTPRRPRRWRCCTGLPQTRPSWRSPGAQRAAPYGELEDLGPHGRHGVA